MKKALFTLGSLLLLLNLAAQQPVPVVDRPVYFDVSPPLRDMAAQASDPKDGSLNENVVYNYIDQSGNRSGIPAPGGDAALQERMGSLLSDSTIQNFPGLPNVGGYIPPDTHGDIGFNHFFQVINCSYAIFNKSGGKIMGPLGNSSVWNGMPHNSNDGDAVVLFDELANRWFFSQFSLPNGSSTAPFYIMIAVSQTPDPTGSWYRWVYEYSQMPDYPKFGIWRDGYYLSTNNFMGGWVGNSACAFDRTAMLAGDPNAQRISFTISPGSDGFTSLLPADCDGAFPAAGTPEYFTYIRTGTPQKLGIYEFHSDWTNPANSTFTNLTYLPVTAFNTMGWGTGIPQLGSPQQLETLGDRLMYRVQYRKFNGYGSMVLNHTVNAGSGKAGVRWYELRNTGTGWSIYQQSTYAPDNNSRWMGSIAQDTAGTISMGYSVSGTSMYPAIRFTGRLKNDPINQMTIAEKTVINGGGSQTGSWSGRSRWGDYSAVCIDPSAPTTFWFTTEYYASTSSSSWVTRIASWTFGNVFSTAASVTPGILCSTTTDSCQLNAYAYGGSGAYTYSWTSIPAGFTSTLSSPKVKPTQTTRYIATISDGSVTRHDTTELRIVPAPTAFAGNDTIVCWYVSPVPLHATATSYDRFLWGSLGDGHFTDPNSLTTGYEPGIKDKTKGYVDIKLICWPLAPCLNKASDMVRIVLDPCTGLQEQKQAGLTVGIYPNPAHQKAELKICGLSGKAYLTICSTDGRLVYNGEIGPNSSGLLSEQIDVSSWPRGMYIVKLNTAAAVTTYRFMID